MTDHYNDDEFEIVRQQYIRQYRARLNLFRHREEIRRREMPVDALQLEEQFSRLLHLIRPKAKYPMNANMLGQHFDEAQRRVIYALVEEIIEKAPWNGIEWSSISQKIIEHRNKSAPVSRS